MIDAIVLEMKNNYKRSEPFNTYVEQKFGSVEAFRNQIKRTETMKLFIKQEIEGKLPVLTEKELKDAYMGAKDKYFLKEEKVEVNDVTFFLDPQNKNSIKKINDFKKKIAEEGVKNLKDIRPDGTYIVQDNVKLHKDQDAKLYEAAKKLGEYGISEPFIIDGTYHVVQLTGYQSEVSKSFEEVKDYLQKENNKRMRQENLNKWIASLRSGATIELVDIAE